jgi:hypothetical protein
MDNITRAVNTSLVNNNEEDEIYSFIEKVSPDVDELVIWLQERYLQENPKLPFPFEGVSTLVLNSISWQDIAADWIDGYNRDNPTEEKAGE